MPNNLDRIVTVEIDIASPVVDGNSFDHLLIIGPPPKNKDHEAPDFGVYYGLDEVTEAGFVAVGEETDIVGVAARVAFSKTPSHVYIAQKKDDESIAHTLESIAGTQGWYCICPVGLSDTDVKAIVEWTETQKKMCCFTTYGPLDKDYLTFYRSFAIYGKENDAQTTEKVPEANKCMNVAFAAECLNYTSGSETWAYKTLAGVTPTELTSTQISKLEASNVSYLMTTASKNITYGGKTLAGEWIDVIRFCDWLQNDMKLGVANLFIVNPKIPYTDQGIGLVDNQMRASLKRGVDCGGIAPVEYDEDGNEIPSFWTKVPAASSITGAQKKTRVLQNCRFAARIAGAIHVAQIKGSLTYEL